jgi:hypothetical protein
MKRLSATVALVALLAATGYGSYLWGWYSGHEYHSVVAGISEAKSSLSAAQSLRQSDPELALELLEASISWMDTTLRDERLVIPAEQRGDFDLVLARLQRYHNDYSVSVGR